MFKKLFVLTLASSMLFSSVQLMSSDTVAQNATEKDKCAQALAKAEDAAWAAKLAEQSAQAAKERADAAESKNKDLGKAIISCGIAATGLGILIATKICRDLYTSSDARIASGLFGLIPGVCASWFSVLETYPTPKNYNYTQPEDILNQTSKFLGGMGLTLAGMIAVS